MIASALAEPRSATSAPPRMRIAVVLACHNRRESTLRCLGALFAQELAGRRLSVFLLDDASSDGTAAAVRAMFPRVEVLEGNGNLYWGQGMHVAMSAALKTEFDALLMLNDDVILAPRALDVLTSTSAQIAVEDGRPSIIVGPVADPETGELTYSGLARTSHWNPVWLRLVAPQPDRPIPCDTMNGNVVLVSAQAARRLGPVDRLFIHQLGDLDYGYRASRAGFGIWVAPMVVGTCRRGNRRLPHQSPGLSPLQRWRRLDSPLGLPIRSWFAFLWRHAGVLGILILAGIWTRILLRDFIGAGRA